MSSRLYYWGTEVEVQLGDKVRIRRLFRRDDIGHVAYIHGVSQPNRELEYEWAIRSEDGTLWCMGYEPEVAQPQKKIFFLGRGTREHDVGPDEIVDETQDADPDSHEDPDHTPLERG